MNLKNKKNLMKGPGSFIFLKHAGLSSCTLICENQSSRERSPTLLPFFSSVKRYLVGLEDTSASRKPASRHTDGWI